MFKSAVIATALAQVSAVKLESYDHNNRAVNPQMVEAINVSAVAPAKHILTLTNDSIIFYCYLL